MGSPRRTAGLAAELDALKAVAYIKSNVLGVVSQLAGVPTGALMEYGTNANGEYWRFAGGLQVCFAKPAGSPSIPAGVATIGPYSLPASYATSDFVVVGNMVPQGTNDMYGITLAYPSSASSFTVVLRNGATTQNFANMRILTVGRWF